MKDQIILYLDVMGSDVWMLQEDGLLIVNVWQRKWVDTG